MGTDLIPLLKAAVTERAKLSTSSLDGARFIYYNHANRCLLSSHPSQSISSIQSWPPISLLYIKPKGSILTPTVLGVFDEYSSQVLGEGVMRWGSLDPRLLIPRGSSAEGASLSLSVRHKQSVVSMVMWCLEWGGVR